VLFVSGLSYGNANSGDGAMCSEILLELLCGQAGSTEDQERMSHVVRVIFAGKIFCLYVNKSSYMYIFSGNVVQDKVNAKMGSRKLRNIESGTQDNLLSSVNRIDEYLSEMLVTILN